jgi:2-polyprenyl-3-methyl-5-hydroxy-6-metoxy-1,4-benzoquinol methylase
MLKQKVWDFWAKRYERLWVQKYSLGPTRRELVRFIEEKLEEGKKYRILDIGCGTGQLLRDIKREFVQYDLELSGVDFSESMICEARGRDSSIDYRVMRVEEIANLKTQYDIITCTHSFPYYEDQGAALRAMRGLLKSEGYLLLAQASQNSFYDNLAMFFVKFTTGKAKYPSVREVITMSLDLFQCESVTRIKERFYMPSIYFFAMRGI